jgi:two-component system response regulator NreC
LLYCQDEGSKLTPISVLLVDNNPIFLRAASRFLETHAEVVVVGTAAGGEEALARAQELRPQVVLIDLAMPDLPGLQAIPRLRAMLPDMGIIALTMLDTDVYRRAALAAGADGFVPKAAMHTDLLASIRRSLKTDTVRKR